MGYDYDGVDRTSFRGKFLELCDEIIGQDLLNAAWSSMLAEELAEWGDALAEAVEAYAKAHNVTGVLGRPSVEFEEDTAQTKAHIVDSAARWARFWSRRGHGSEAYF